MKSRQSRALQAFRRVEAWFAENPQVLTNAGSSQAALSNQIGALKQVVETMTAGATEQTMQKSQATLAARDETTLRTEIRSLHVKAIVRVAGALRGKVSGMGVFKLPADSLSSETLLHAAEAVRTAASVYKDVFVEHGLPIDFLDRLETAGAALKESVDARGVARSRVAGATKTLASELALGRQILTILDAALSHTLRSDASLLTSWRQAKRVTVKGVASRAPLIAGPVPGSAASAAPSNVSVTPSVVSLVSNGGSPERGVAPVDPPVASIAPSGVPVQSNGGPAAPSVVPSTTFSETKAA